VFLYDNARKGLVLLRNAQKGRLGGLLILGWEQTASPKLTLFNKNKASGSDTVEGI